MTKKHIFSAFAGLFFSIPAMADSFTLQLLHFADIDGNEQSALSSVDEFAALVGAFKADPVYGPNTLFVSSGDNILPGPRFYAAEQRLVKNLTGSNEPGHADIVLLNEMGVQASALGNHEFDVGPGELADAIEADGSSTAQFPYLAINIDFSGDENFQIGMNGEMIGDLAGKVAGYAVAKIGGESIGLIGVVTPTLPFISSPYGLDVSPPPTSSMKELTPIIQEAVDSLHAIGINKIILLSHMQQIEYEKELANLIKGVDIIVAGGSDTRMGDLNDRLFSNDLITDKAFAENYPYETTDAEGNPVILVNVDADYKYLGRLVVTFDEKGRVQPDSIDPQVSGAYAATEEIVDLVGGIRNVGVIAIRNAVQEVITRQFGNVVGYTKVYLDGRRSKVRTEETNLGNLSADANLWYANQLSEQPVHLSLKNGGGIRTGIGSALVPPGATDYSKAVYTPPVANPEAKTAEGAVSEGHLRATLRFDNGLVVVSVTAAELKDLLENGLADTAVGRTPGRFPHVAGMKFSYDSTMRPRSTSGTGQRVRSLVTLTSDGTVKDTIVKDGEIFGNPDRRFNLVTLNFLANGGDDYPFQELSNPNRLNLYAGRGYGENFDYPSADINGDPGRSFKFSYTGGNRTL
ncbi:MAG: bifunctional metallophosphatase/5'-nucleotidase [SAR324 cluster bacterium]|uniref:Bifunctional metallophosphatase/5'-nucleotidase n=1 Tax=SAR324 cluster bacterium TaxID=2024889 RepID=A0A2D6YIY6_9DELT|nr:bifunctional metallophosphatase/5'-nucleotidase [SAR324 cluster bacterium]